MTISVIDVYLDKNNLISYLDIISLKADMNLYYGIDVAKKEMKTNWFLLTKIVLCEWVKLIFNRIAWKGVI